MADLGRCVQPAIAIVTGALICGLLSSARPDARLAIITPMMEFR